MQSDAHQKKINGGFKLFCGSYDDIKSIFEDYILSALEIIKNVLVLPGV